MNEIEMNTADVRYTTALASIRMVSSGAVLDLSEDDYTFLTADKLWLATDRNRARRCIEAAVYGALDFVGFPRFPAPAEFIAATIAYYVNNVNVQSACAIMDGCEFSEYITSGVEQPVSARQLFSFVLRIRGGLLREVEGVEQNVKTRLQVGS
ncbi:external scaffolding protein D [Lelliottia sp. SL45]|uniref:external scaffolding protein D n=1 Tax=Lelliottia sp. SL45 TaxID=2994665 RepID=UPI003FA3BAF4